MSHLLIYVGIGSIVALAFTWWFLRDGAPRASHEFPVHTSLAAVLEHRPYVLAGRIFAEEDWRVARALLSPEDQKKFLRDRKLVALMLLDEIRLRAGQIIFLHRETAREAVELKSSAEVKLAATYASLLVFCTALKMFVRLRGPFAAAQIAARLNRTADAFWLVSETFLAKLHSEPAADGNTTSS